jgi:hypothetical protein
MSVSNLTDFESFVKSQGEEAFHMDETRLEDLKSGTLTDTDIEFTNVSPSFPLESEIKLESSTNVQGDVNNRNIGEEMKEALNNTNMTTILNQISNNPDLISKMMEESMAQMTPEMMEKAKKMATGGQGQQLLRNMQRRGIDTQPMKAKLIAQQKALKNSIKSEPNKRTVLITAGRKLKIRNIPVASIQTSATRIIKSESVIELSCSRMASGPLQGKTIKVWYDPNRGGKNPRASKIVGFPIAGDLLIIMEEGDLTEEDFITAERLLI